MYAMAPCCLILSIFVTILPISAQISSHQNTILSKCLDTKISELEVQMHATPPRQRPEIAKTTDAIPHKGHTLTPHQQSHFQNVYGILILIGWGALLPIGVLIARYCRQFPVMCDAWYWCHIVCQTLGYVMGTTGWCIRQSKHSVSKTQNTLGIIAFTFISIQMLSIFVRPNKETGYCKCWNICHHVVGYAIIGIVIANIFAGLHNQSQAETLKWVYVGILGVLALIVVPMEIFRCKSAIMLQFVRLTGSVFSNDW